MAVLPGRLEHNREGVEAELPLLVNGDHLDQPTFHARYEAMPEGTRAELIGGIVFMASPVGGPHRRYDMLVSKWLGAYEDATPGTEALGSGTAILGQEDEPEPDLTLQILPEYGGSTREEGGYVVGAPELVVEIAVSSAAIDLHRKKDRYELAGVKEYLVVEVRSRKVHWYTLEADRYQLLTADVDGILRSRRFPGLWLDPVALIERDRVRIAEVQEAGLRSPEHAEFVQQLAERRLRREQRPETAGD